MSLILEALKKSEAERQLGRAPGLLSPTVRVSRQRGPSAWWGVILLAAAIALGAGWWLGRAGDEPPAPIAATPASLPESLPPAVPSPAPATAPEPTTRPTPVAAPAARDDAPLPRDPEFASVERESVPVAAREAPVIAAPPPALPDPAPPVSAPPAPLPATVPPIPTATLPAEVPTPALDAPATLPAVDTSTPPAPPAEAPLEALPSYNELMPDVRATLPALKLSMHVYAADPSARFVLIDGKRLAQGDRLAPTLVLEEIRRDGAVLDFGGKRFVVPRP